jgi:hypothetical protein
MPALVSVLVYTWIFPNPYSGEHRPHNIHAVIAASAGALFWIMIQAAWGKPRARRNAGLDQAPLTRTGERHGVAGLTCHNLLRPRARCHNS